MLRNIKILTAFLCFFLLTETWFSFYEIKPLDDGTPQKIKVNSCKNWYIPLIPYDAAFCVKDLFWEWSQYNQYLFSRLTWLYLLQKPLKNAETVTFIAPFSSIYLLDVRNNYAYIEYSSWNQVYYGWIEKRFLTPVKAQNAMRDNAIYYDYDMPWDWSLVLYKTISCDNKRPIFSWNDNNWTAQYQCLPSVNNDFKDNQFITTNSITVYFDKNRTKKMLSFQEGKSLQIIWENKNWYAILFLEWNLLKWWWVKKTNLKWYFIDPKNI